MRTLRVIKASVLYDFKEVVVLGNEIVEQLYAIKNAYQSLVENTSLHTTIKAFYEKWGKKGLLFLTDYDDFCIDLEAILLQI